MQYELEFPHFTTELVVIECFYGRHIKHLDRYMYSKVAA